MELPDEFLEWQFEKRGEGIRALLKGKHDSYEAHLPVMATYGKKKVNLAVKGVGLVPKESLLMGYIKECVLFIDECVESGWNKSSKKRLEFLLEVYSHPENFDKTILSNIEMYGTKTFANVKKSKECALMFNDLNYKTLISWQVNCKVKMLHFPDPVYRYTVLMHSMFHSLKQDYLCVYKFKVKELLDKRP